MGRLKGVKTEPVHFLLLGRERERARERQTDRERESEREREIDR